MEAQFRPPRAALKRVLGWDALNVVMARGVVALGGGSDIIRQSFAWP
jgi:hypothetical protein